jgi:type IV pilus assembly protein PilV
LLNNLTEGEIKVKDSLNSKGFTLIEVLVALVILAVSLLALAGLMTTSTRNTASGGRLTEAATFAQDKLEELRAIKWGDVASNSDSVTGSTGITYTRSWEIGGTDTDPLKEILVTINWDDPTRRSLRFLSVLSNPRII